METIYVAYESCELHSSASVCSSLDVDLVYDAGGRCMRECVHVHRGLYDNKRLADVRGFPRS